MHATLPPMLCDMDEDKNIWEDCEQAEKQIKYDESDPKVIIGASLNKLIAILTSVDDYGKVVQERSFLTAFCRHQVFAHIHYHLSILYHALQTF